MAMEFQIHFADFQDTECNKMDPFFANPDQYTIWGSQQSKKKPFIIETTAKKVSRAFVENVALLSGQDRSIFPMIDMGTDLTPSKKAFLIDQYNSICQQLHLIFLIEETTVSNHFPEYICRIFR